MGVGEGQVPNRRQVVCCHSHPPTHITSTQSRQAHPAKASLEDVLKIFIGACTSCCGANRVGQLLLMMAMISASTMLAKAHYDGGGVTVLLRMMLAKVLKKMLVMIRMEMERMEMVMMMMMMMTMMMMVMMITIMIMMTIAMMVMTATSETSRHPQ